MNSIFTIRSWGNSVCRSMRLQNHLHLVIFFFYCLWCSTPLCFLSFYLFFLLFLFLLFCFRNQMGNLLKVLTCTELDQGPNFFLDFESEQSFCLAWCLSLFPATNILQVPLSELSLQMCSSQRNSKPELHSAFACANASCKWVWSGEFYLFYVECLILRTWIANTKIFKCFLEEKKTENLICCWQMCMTYHSVFVTNHITNMAVYVYVAWYFLWEWSPYSLQLLLALWYFSNLCVSFWNLSSFNPLPLYTYPVNCVT